MKKFKDIITKYFDSDIYLISLITLSVLTWVFKFDLYVLPIFIALIILVIFFSKKTIHIIPIFFCITISTSLFRDNDLLIAILSGITIVLLIIDWLLNRKFKSFGIFSLPLLIMVILTIISGINAPKFFVWFQSITQIGSVLIVYLYARNTIKYEEGIEIYLAKMFTYYALGIAFEIGYFYLTYDGFIIDAIRYRRLDLGWENMNVVIYPILVAIPLTSYLLVKLKYKILYFLFLEIEIIAILLTISRSSILSVVVYIIMITPLVIYFTKDRKRLLIHTLIFLAILSISYYILEQYDVISEYIKLASSRKWDKYEDRLFLIKIALDNYKQHPIIGTGGVHTSHFFLAEYGARNYHNTIVQTLTLGSLGILSFIYLHYIKFKLLLTKSNPFKYFIFVLLVVTIFVNGMFQPMYYYVTYMIQLFIILAILEIKDYDKINE